MNDSSAGTVRTSSMSNCQTELPALPAPWDFTYEWVTTPFGVRRSFSANHYNGSPCTNQVPIFTAGQMRAYATAAVLTERERFVSRLRHEMDLDGFGCACEPTLKCGICKASDVLQKALGPLVKELAPPPKEPT